MALLAHPERF
jgi:hypothetical protein